MNDDPTPEQSDAVPNRTAPTDALPISNGSASDDTAPITVAPTTMSDDGAQEPGAPATTHPEHRRHASAWSRRRRVIAAAGAAALFFGAGAGVGVLSTTVAADRTAAASGSVGAFGQGTGGSTGGSGAVGGSTSGGSTSGGFGSGSTGRGSFGGGVGGQGGAGQGFGSGSGSDSGTAVSGTAATSAQKQGVVTIVSQLKYQGATSAGTGIVLTSSGEILTNNHVVEGSTSIVVTVQSTGAKYTATVVGTDATHDIAVLKLAKASGLTTASIASEAAAVGDRVTAVGNAEGGGTLIAAAGSVTALKQAITTASENGTASENLKGLIETDADVVSGDSGGPLLDSSGEVVGIDTAASSGTSDVTGYAITISSALDIAKKIEAGEKSATIIIGLPAFLGVEVSQAASSTTGATVSGVIAGTPAAKAGLDEGDVVTKVNGTAISSPTSLTTLLHSYAPGKSVTITYTDSEGGTHTATVTLIAGPAA